ncbi:glycine cleavage complex lipoylprotein [Candidatus Hydrogenisulfobacillus filiaventi]|uniref:Glycine cleavage system H protein n=1 Tax=Candidatus Hydrogenisulfobacillus filiaventi TaxID=2707344 RepID=A0A6F8ZH53_9FIRM|nr:glycine cleavage system protein GcvH [Bacillota bacterium]CAB1128924.1 glycine cleavage complex lipoylprotein [Candidatus Hydrogenisulfobacillus filiaventi]
MEFPAHLRYTREHEWIDGDGRVGITDFAQDALGDVVFVELPETGRKLAPGDAFAVVESVKSVSDIYSPVGGTVVEVNEALRDHPELVNQDPYGSGWIARLAVDQEPPDLLTADAYRALTEGA